MSKLNKEAKEVLMKILSNMTDENQSNKRGVKIDVRTEHELQQCTVNKRTL
ncbi:MAG: hypothetical protein J6Y78_10840 [Paludibacteraceae bacterium]|nr:hypothetical protein [Paludibacteraceae bacterium]